MANTAEQKPGAAVDQGVETKAGGERFAEIQRQGRPTDSWPQQGESLTVREFTSQQKFLLQLQPQ